ncbi:MAG: transglycosylase SLT domain-containing protein [Alphaproteobacteria bacterium]
MSISFGQYKGDILAKYQGVASQDVIKAVEKASSRTGVDFAFLMEKASTESNFNPTAKSKSSSARGLFQFLEETWLRVVKKHGDKYGLGDLADKIEIKGGRACCTADREKILALRNNPEISALMAGEFSSDNKDYLKGNTKDKVGSTELYLAHFMGAGGAAKFLNARAMNGDALAKDLFPTAAKANKTIFYDSKKQPRSLDEVYNLFAKKFGSVKSTPSSHPTQDVAVAKAPAPKATPLDLFKGRALPVFDDNNEKDDIIWNDDPRFMRHPSSGFSKSKIGLQKLHAQNILMMAELTEKLPVRRSNLDKFGYNS